LLPAVKQAEPLGGVAVTKGKKSAVITAATKENSH